MPENVAEILRFAGVNWLEDAHNLRTGAINRKTLLEFCLDGADPEYHAVWREYVEWLTTE